MSFTNQTQHYGLPQYIGTDVPAYLTDYNGAMATIDQGMNAAKTQADAAATAAGQAANDITALNSTVQTQATQISAAAQSASSAQTTANTADQKADDLDVRVTALEGATGVTVTKKSFNVEITQQYGQLYINSPAVPYSDFLPAGKTTDDLISIVVTEDSGGGIALLNTRTGVHFACPIRSTNQTITVNVTTK